MSRRERPAEALDRVAGVVDRLCALVAAGAPAATAWSAIAASATGEDAALARAVAAAAAAGEPMAPCFAGRVESWQRAGVLVVLAVEAGAPLAPALRRAADGLRDAAAMHRAVRGAVAGPAANARLTMALPLATLVLGEALGFDVLRVLATTPIGWAATAGALLLLAAAFRWTSALVRRAGDVPWTEGLREDLVVLGVTAGLPLAAARARAQQVAARVGVALAEDGVDSLAAFAERAGVPVAALLAAEADRRRRAVQAGAAERAAALSARLLLPLGALVLPAFLLVGALPIGVAILSSTALPA